MSVRERGLCEKTLNWKLTLTDFRCWSQGPSGFPRRKCSTSFCSGAFAVSDSSAFGILNFVFQDLSLWIPHSPSHFLFCFSENICWVYWKLMFCCVEPLGFSVFLV